MVRVFDWWLDLLIGLGLLFGFVGCWVMSFVGFGLICVVWFEFSFGSVVGNSGDLLFWFFVFIYFTIRLADF